MSQLIIVLSGKKQSGKSTAGKQIFAHIANQKEKNNRYALEKSGNFVDTFSESIIDIDIPIDTIAKDKYEKYGIKLYSFADPLKQFCNKALGIDLKLLYGSNSDKNKKTHIVWENLPPNIRVKYSKPKRGSDEYTPAKGKMSVREVLQVFGTDVCRAMDENCWARSLYKTIESENYPIAIVLDCRFPNEVTMGTERGAKVIRLLRSKKDGDDHRSETALDDFPLGEYSNIIDNTQMSFSDKNDRLLEVVRKYLEQYGY